MRKHLYAGVATAVLAVLAAGLEIAPAAAQFVCVGNATGATVPPATADGAGANASGGVNNVACGSNANASGSSGFNTAAGNNADASGDNSLNTAIGREANASGDKSRNTAIGNQSRASGDNSLNMASGFAATATGDNSSNTASGNISSAFGNNSRNTATGASAVASGSGSTNTATGASSNASGEGSSNVAIGNNARAIGDGGARTAIGARAHAEGANSSAFGAGAVATRDNQMAFGTKDNTYTMGGITSAASSAAQSGPVGLVTTDAFGNLASDGGAIQRQIDSLGRRDRELADGIAISLALAQPFFHAGQTFAMNVGWGNFDGSSAFGVTAAGIVNRGALGPTSTVTLHGGIGVGADQGTIAGRAGLSFGW